MEDPFGSGSLEKYLEKTPVVCLAAMLCCLLWGSAFPCIKIGYRLFHIVSGDTASQILFAGYRFTLAGIFTVVLGSIQNRKPFLPRRASFSMIVKLGMVQTVLQYVFFYIGLAHTTGVKSSIIGAANVFIAILFSCFLFHYETITFQKWLGCSLGFLGVVLINLQEGGLEGGIQFWGEGCILLSTAAYGLSSGLIKKYSAKENPVLLSGWQFFFGGICMVIAAWAAGGRVEGFTVHSTLLLFYLGFLSAVAYSLWGILLKYNPVGKVAVFGFMNPVFGVLLSSLLLQEKNQAYSLQGAIALLLVCCGIWIVNRKQS